MLLPLPLLINGKPQILFSPLPVEGSIEHLYLQHGDAFRLSLAGRKMTFLFHPEALWCFFAAPTDQIAFRWRPSAPETMV